MMMYSLRLLVNTMTDRYKRIIVLCRGNVIVIFNLSALLSSPFKTFYNNIYTLQQLIGVKAILGHWHRTAALFFLV